MSRRFTAITRVGIVAALLLTMLSTLTPPLTGAATPGSMYSWGADSSGGLCLGSVTTRQLTPQPAIGAATSDVIAVTTGNHFTLLLKQEGTIFACGYNVTYGMLGIGVADGNNHPTPQQVVGVSGATAIASGVNHSLAVAGGNVYAWGSNTNGELGQASADGNAHPTPAQVPGLTDVKAVATGYATSFAIKNDNTLWSWGINNAGQLGLGVAGGNHTSPAQVFLSPGVPLLAKSVASGQQFTAVVATDGKVYTFGANTEGEAGTGATDTSNHPTPTQNSILGTDNSTIASGYRHLVVLKTGGTVWAWGQDDQGQVGRGAPTTIASTPAAVAGITGAVAIGTGYGHSMALLSDGTVRTWGVNGAGQLGNNSQSPSGTPVQAGALTNVVALSTGIYAQHSLAIKVTPPATTIVSVSPLSLQFPNQPLNIASAPKTVRLSNSGQQPLVVSNITIVGTNPGDFAQTNDCSATVPPTGTCTINVTFTPSATGSRTATLRITDNAATSPQEVSLSGTGLDVPPPFNLIVTFAGSGSGTVAVAATGISQPTTDHYLIPQNNVATATAQSPSGYFIGWKLDGIYVGWANPVTLTMNTDHTLEATFAPIPAFGDVPSGQPYTDAVLQLAARDIIRGCDQTSVPRFFCPDDHTLRAQMAALIARAMGWDAEDHTTAFPDQGTVDNDLWRNVGTVAFYNVARGYQDGTYDPTGDVLHAQTISFLTRAMITKAYWNLQPDDPALYPNVPGASGHRQDLATFVHYAGALPDFPNPGAAFTSWDQPSVRAWFARALWQALNSYFSQDLPGSGGYIP